MWNLFNTNVVSSANPITIGVQLTNFSDWTSYNSTVLVQDASPVLTAGFGFYPQAEATDSVILPVLYTDVLSVGVSQFGFGVANSSN